MILSAYIHIPFCSYKCDFCDFAAYAGLLHLAPEYCEVVGNEIEIRLNELHEKPLLTSIFYGGGTPGLIDPALIGGLHKKLLSKVERLAPDAEVTLETTPQAITKEKALAWLEIGINRLSIGVESLQDTELKTIGRDHTVEEALRGIELAIDAGFTNISCDFMYGLPSQTLSSWQDTLNRFINLANAHKEITHFSAYALDLAPKSPLAIAIPAASTQYPSEDEFLKIYRALIEISSAGGFKQYEISNFCKPGYESEHNLNYWSNQEYLAFGVGAHRYLKGVRSSNWRALKRYMADSLGFELNEVIDTPTRLKEGIMLGLRKMAGINISSFEAQYGVNLLEAYAKQISKLESASLIEAGDGTLRLTSEAVPISNLVIAEFF
jgi:oxygen-independent coproporphyrinogen III oxidase